LRRILGGLALGVIEVGRHCDDRTIEVVIETVFGAVTQGGQDFGTHLHRRLGALHRLNAQHARLIDKAVRQLFRMGNVLQAASHETFDRSDGVGRVLRRVFLGIVTNLTPLAGQIAHDRGQDHTAIAIGQAFSHPMAHRRHQ